MPKLKDQYSEGLYDFFLREAQSIKHRDVDIVTMNKKDLLVAVSDIMNEWKLADQASGIDNAVNVELEGKYNDLLEKYEDMQQRYLEMARKCDKLSIPVSPPITTDASEKNIQTPPQQGGSTLNNNHGIYNHNDW